MAIAALKRITNCRNFTVKVRGLENASMAGHDVPIPPANDWEVDCGGRSRAVISLHLLPDTRPVGRSQACTVVVPYHDWRVTWR
jgi:hypothetical protein